MFSNNKFHNNKAAQKLYYITLSLFATRNANPVTVQFACKHTIYILYITSSEIVLTYKLFNYITFEVLLFIQVIIKDILTDYIDKTVTIEF